VPLAEKALIAQIRRLATSSRRKSSQAPGCTIIRGIGDDCAVLRVDAGCDSLVTTDFTLEGIHFRRAWHSPESVGHRCLTRGLSDIAAMGGEPRAIFLSLALPSDLLQFWVNRFIASLTSLAGKHGATLAGGDISQSPGGVLADIIVIGTVPRGKAILRSSAKPGDRIYVTGELGGSAAAIDRLRLHPKKKLDPRAYPRHFYPEPRLKLSRILREKNLVSAMIDTSDGLSTDLSHICEESGVGAEIDSSSIPRARVGKPAHQVHSELAMHGGEDYELLFTAPKRKHVPNRIAGVMISEIGKITRSKEIFLKDSKGQTSKLHPQGWEHFRD
jgi:thiamine-monophosphate kinase